jgi:hypothetical protein
LPEMTKALRAKRPARIPMLGTVVQKYLQDDDLGAQAPFGERALGWSAATRPGPQRGDGASGPAGAREAQLRAHRGANPRPADRVRDGRGPAGWHLTGLFTARAGKAILVRLGTEA